MIGELGLAELTNAQGAVAAHAAPGPAVTAPQPRVDHPLARLEVSVMTETVPRLARWPPDGPRVSGICRVSQLL